MSTKYIIITVDTNDADYITAATEINCDILESIKPVIAEIKKFKQINNMPHQTNFPTGDCVRDDLGVLNADKLYGNISGYEDFYDLLPNSEYGFHTIKSIKLLTVTKEEDLL